MTINRHSLSGDAHEPEKPWQDRASDISSLMRSISTLNDPQDVVTIYGNRMREIIGHNGTVSLSRRGLERPHYRITRSSVLGVLDPWKNPGKLPHFDRGILGDLIYGDEARIIHDFKVDPSDPAAEHLAGARSLVALPQYDGGASINMVVMMSREPRWFEPEQLPQLILQTNLFGRATNNLVLSRRLREAYDKIDAELQVVSDIQKSLLPTEFPYIPSLKLASDYQSSSRAGGDYYDFFPLGQGKYGVLIADVSGHGTPAAVLMAIVHAIAHLIPGGPHPPQHVMGFINRQLARKYTSGNGSFVTAFYGVFDEHERTLTYSNAGHPSPLWKKHGQERIDELPSVHSGLPLGIMEEIEFSPESVHLSPGDSVLLYTDGISEARGDTGEMYGTERLKNALRNALCSKHPMGSLIEDLGIFCGTTPAGDDRTMLLAQVR
ncbi:MAG TPA: PP2C family protein-serine/threonine phosphatase [Phycisphaerales bacterium]|nr:PP2C family protein-serine/threonine phosphatase [Phycisphaerales bacterium]